VVGGVSGLGAPAVDRPFNPIGNISSLCSQ
jgi:hypothetical protein